MGPEGAQVFNESLKMNESLLNNSQDEENKDTYDLDICFWEKNPKENMWSNLKALQLYETANIILMVYNADDRMSFESLK